MKDNFSAQAHLYAKYRPLYPTELYDFILTHVRKKDSAWDCATGNGQAAKELSNHFKNVFATDISAKQIENAYRAENIFYSAQPAEKTSFSENSFDLVTVATGMHWLKFDEFFKEVKRVTRPEALLAAWAYSLLNISNEIDEIIRNYHFGTMAAYWDKERRYVDENYATIPFPFEEIKAPPFSIELFWTLSDLQGYLNTWSALQKFMKTNHYNPVPHVIKKIEPHWENNVKRKITFPVFLRLGRIH